MKGCSEKICFLSAIFATLQPIFLLLIYLIFSGIVMSIAKKQQKQNYEKCANIIYYLFYETVIDYSGK